MLKKIEAIVRREKFEDVKKALSDIGIVGLSVSQIQGRGRGAGMLIHGRTGTYSVDLLPKTMVTIILSDHNVQATVKAIQSAAITGDKGDGIIVVSPVENVIRISTGEEGAEAIKYQGDIDTRESVGGM